MSWHDTILHAVRESIFASGNQSWWWNNLPLILDLHIKTFICNRFPGLPLQYRSRKTLFSLASDVGNKESAPLWMGYCILPPKRSCRKMIYHYLTRILPSYLLGSAHQRENSALPMPTCSLVGSWATPKTCASPTLWGHQHHFVFRKNLAETCFLSFFFAFRHHEFYGHRQRSAWLQMTGTGRSQNVFPLAVKRRICRSWIGRKPSGFPTRTGGSPSYHPWTCGFL